MSVKILPLNGKETEMSMPHDLLDKHRSDLVNSQKTLTTELEASREEFFSSLEKEINGRVKDFLSGIEKYVTENTTQYLVTVGKSTIAHIEATLVSEQEFMVGFEHRVNSFHGLFEQKTEEKKPEEKKPEENKIPISKLSAGLVIEGVTPDEHEGAMESIHQTLKDLHEINGKGEHT